ncbi:tetraspanin 37 isoform X2 [Nelusetta ayraudi]|uniref:tetraspanin 37 isoform X2 n=1 Tax=Nelusetta ayraudi TaxID=303726 RepID=UPI003F717947
MICRKKTCVQRALRVLSLLLWVLAVLVGLSAYYLLKNYKRSSMFFSDTNITLPAFLAVTCAAVLVLGGLLGCCLSKDSPCMQGMLHSELAPLSGIFMNYTGSSQDSLSLAVDATQKEFQCCGVHGYEDWFLSPWFNHTGRISVPLSCCNSTFLSCNGTVDMPLQLYSQGCQVKLEKVLQFFLRFILLDLPLVFLVEVILILTVAQLMRNRPDMGYHNMDKRY